MRLNNERNTKRNLKKLLKVKNRAGANVYKDRKTTWRIGLTKAEQKDLDTS